MSPLPPSHPLPLPLLPLNPRRVFGFKIRNKALLEARTCVMVGSTSDAACPPEVMETMFETQPAVKRETELAQMPGLRAHAELASNGPLHAWLAERLHVGRRAALDAEAELGLAGSGSAASSAQEQVKG